VHERSSGATLRPSRPRLRGAGRFLALFGAALVAGHAVLALPPVERGFARPWTSVEVQLAAVVLGASGLPARAEAGGQLVAHTGVRLDVNRGCDGLDALAILTAAILAFPAGWRARLAGLAVGALAMFVTNALRIASLMLVAVRWPQRLDFFHVDVWQPAMMLVAFALFCAFALLARREQAAADHAG